MNLGIQSQECNQCGAMIYPHDSVSTKGEKTKIEIHAIPPLSKKIKSSEMDGLELNYKKNAKSVKRTDTETEVTFEIERHLALVEGDENAGCQKFPLCGFVLVSWTRQGDDMKPAPSSYP